jgi:phosphotransacetylase
MSRSADGVAAPGGSMLERWCARLDGTPRVVLAEGDDPRVRRASDLLARLGIVPVLVVRDGRELGRASLDSRVECVPIGDLAAGPAGDLVREAGEGRGWPLGLQDDRAAMPAYLSAALVRLGLADACVAGTTAPTADVIRAGLHMIGLRPGVVTLSSSFLLLLPDGKVMGFGDCAVVPEPDADQLAEIAVSTADTFATLAGEEPAVAMLSFSTLGSAEHQTARRVRNATALARIRKPQLVVDGEMQFDAAIVSSVAAQKAPGSEVAGQANVFIFPDLNAGNIGYKIAQRLGGAQAFGPILQGLQAPMNDLSRGCDVADVVHVSVISALQAQSSRPDASCIRLTRSRAAGIRALSPMPCAPASRRRAAAARR